MAELATLGHPALGDGPLAGGKIVKMVFFDESGTGSIAKEPNFVLAGVIIHADKQWKAIENHLSALWEKHCPIPLGDRPLNLCFHAQELYSGGKVFTREAFPKEKRWAILDELVAIPAKFDLPIVASYTERAIVPEIVNAYPRCYVENAAVVEEHMRSLPDREEVASIVCEDLPQVHEWVRSMHRYAQHRVHLAGDLHAHDRDRYRLTRVIGPPHFEGKSPYSPLQIADAIAFVMAAVLLKKPDARRFYTPLVPMLIGRYHPKPGAYRPLDEEPPA